MRKVVLLLTTAGLFVAGAAIGGPGIVGAASGASAGAGGADAQSAQVRGPRGRRGARGPRGRRGATGAQGPPGFGIQGPPGPAGPSGGGLRVLLQASGATEVRDLLVVNGHRIRGGCTANQPVLASQTAQDNATVKGLGDGSGAKFYSEDDDFDIGDTSTHTNATTQDSAIHNLTYATLGGAVDTAVIGVESSSPNFDCLIYGTVTRAP